MIETGEVKIWVTNESKSGKFEILEFLAGGRVRLPVGGDFRGRLLGLEIVELDAEVFKFKLIINRAEGRALLVAFNQWGARLVVFYKLIPNITEVFEPYLWDSWYMTA